MRLFLTLLLCLVAIPATAQVSDDLARTFIEETGVDTDAGEIAGQLVQQIQAQAAQLPEPARAPFREIYAEAMGEDALDARLVAYVTRTADSDDLRAALAWMGEPISVRMLALEDSSESDPNASVAVQMYAMTGNFASAPVSPEREAQMDRYLAVTGATADAVDLYLDLIVASSTSMSALAPEGEGPPSADTIRARMRPMLEGQIPGMVRGGTLYAYRDATDEEFDAYIAGLETPAAQYANDLASAALSAAIVGATADAGEAFVQTLMDLDDAGEIDLDEMRSQGEEEMESEMEMNEEMEKESEMEMEGSDS